jgi:CubicO group peptidase (beta-lactamase class C family)
VRRIGSSGAAATPDTPFQAASLSKTVAAVAALALVDRGKLALDADINDRLDAWKLPPSPLADRRAVTLRRLLGMTGGINVPGYAGYRAGAPLPTLVQVLEGKPPANSEPVRIVAPPGAQYLYSGGGYEIVQAAIEFASGNDFARTARDTVLAPCGMSLAGFEQPLPLKRAANVADGHLIDGSPMSGNGNVFPELAAAGLWATPTDLARFLVALLRSHRGETGALLSPATVKEMLSPVDDFGYGLGGSIRGRGRELVLMKRGHNLGFHCYMLIYPEAGAGAVVMTNSENGDRVIEPFLHDLAMREGWPPIAEFPD